MSTTQRKTVSKGDKILDISSYIGRDRSRSRSQRDVGDQMAVVKYLPVSIKIEKIILLFDSIILRDGKLIMEFSQLSDSKKLIDLFEDSAIFSVGFVNYHNKSLLGNFNIVSFDSIVEYGGQTVLTFTAKKATEVDESCLNGFRGLVEVIFKKYAPPKNVEETVLPLVKFRFCEQLSRVTVYATDYKELATVMAKMPNRIVWGTSTWNVVSLIKTRDFYGEVAIDFRAEPLDPKQKSVSVNNPNVRFIFENTRPEQ